MDWGSGAKVAMRTWILLFVASAATAQTYRISTFVGGGVLTDANGVWKKAGADGGLWLLQRSFTPAHRPRDGPDLDAAAEADGFRWRSVR